MPLPKQRKTYSLKAPKLPKRFGAKKAVKLVKRGRRNL